MTQKYAWLTDIHLEMLSSEQAESFFRSVRDVDPTGVLVGGDIATAGTLALTLLKMQKIIAKPIYFVLGNHDYYGGDIEPVRKSARLLMHQNPEIHWLPQTGVVELSPQVALVGHGGWSDGGYGDFMASEIMLTDYVQIKSLVTSEKAERLSKLKQLGDDAASTLRLHLKQALEHNLQVYVLTHSPPFIESCWYEGKTPSVEDAYLPHFTCKAIGDLLLDMASTHPDKSITVLCGHTHGSGTAQIRPNLHVITGGAEYEKPVIQKIFEVD